ncbi:protein of unknown function DUF1080 [Microbacterium laevaniformans OR221]|nr:protein of unknown function DUF1080 [Microbacterium laevaniformans OR221]
MPNTLRLRRRSQLHIILLAIVLALFAQVLVPGGAAHATAGTVAATPSSSTGVENNDYPRMIRLTTSADTNRRGDLLAMYSINDTGVRTHSVVKRSTDGGSTWTTISSIYSPTPGWGVYFASMYELPAAAGGLPAGTLIAAATAWDNQNWGNQEIQTFVSFDYGVTWTQRGNCVTKAGAPNTVSTGLWEPEIILNADGKIACHFADERLRASGTSQKLVMVTSSDGGMTWGNQIDTAAIADNSSRPGMPVVRKLGNGSYLLAYELCRDSVGNADQTCRVYTKTSSNGASWGTPSDLGNLVQTDEGMQLLHTPALAWAPGGGANGTLMMSGQRVVTGTDGPSTVVRPETGRVLFVNTNNGVGNWKVISSPITVDPTGDYNNGPGKQCANYSPSLVPTAAGNAVMMLATEYVAGSNTRCELRFGTGPIGSLPLYAPFDSGNDSGWSTYGGTWSVNNGVYSQTDSSSGPKSLVGSSGWTDVTVTSDLRLDAAGQAGVLLRTTSPSTGADSHTGYYVGVESSTGRLIIGAQNNGYTALAASAVSGGVAVGEWYSLQVTAVGCSITATLKRYDAPAVTTATANPSGCFAAGQAGVRSHLTPASFRNVHVTPAASSSTGIFSESWGSGNANGWSAVGGNWSTVAGSGIQRQSATGNDGPKFISPAAGNSYTVSANAKITSLSEPNGNAGLLARVTDPTVGANSYSGYYAGIDGTTSRLSLGKAAAGNWNPVADAAVPGGVSTDGWYHLSLRATGCTLTATAQKTTSWDQAVVTANDANCVGSGAAGIRTYLSTADYVGFAVTPG